MAASTSKTWFVTGSSSGFGLILAEQALARGDRVAATARRLESLDALKSKYGEALWTARLDVTDTGAVRRVMDEAFAALGRIDVVVSNAGYGLFGAIEELADDQIRRQLETNLLGSISVIRSAIPHMRAQGGGRILQLSSVGGQAAFPGLSLYHASKWGMEGFVEAVAREVEPFGIQLTLVEPGGARTDFGSRSLDLAEPMDVYEAGRIGDTRRHFAERQATAIGSPEKMVAAMMATADQDQAPRRLALGSDCYRIIHRALTTRLAELEAQEALAASTDDPV